MADCVNHEGIEAVSHCLQCSRPVCAECVVMEEETPFCCDACRQSHADFRLREADLAGRRLPRDWGKTIGWIFFTLAVLVVIYLGWRHFGPDLF